MRIPRLALLACAPLAGCVATYTLSDLDALARQVEARTIVLEPDLSIYSPYDLVATRTYVDLVREQRDEVFALLGVPTGAPVLVWLRPDAGLSADVTVEGDEFRVKSLGSGPEDRVLGHARESLVQVRVGAPTGLALDDGRVITTSYDARMYADTVRHELAHVAMDRMDHAGPEWVNEGVAHAIEWIPVADGRFDVSEGPERLRAVALLPREVRDVERFLGWRQSFPVREGDGLARSLAFTFVAFLCDTESLAVRDGLERLARLTPDEVRARGDAWSSWLDRFAIP